MRAWVVKMELNTTKKYKGQQYHWWVLHYFTTQAALFLFLGVRLMKPFIKFMRDSEKFESLIKIRPTAIALLNLVAYQARRTPNEILGLEIGETLIANHESYGVTRQTYRTDKEILEKFNFVTTKVTNRGTIIKLIDNTIFDINIDEGNQQTNHQLTISQPSANHQLTTLDDLKNDKNDKNENNEKNNNIYKAKDFPAGLEPPDRKGMPKSFEAVVDKFKDLGDIFPKDMAKEYLERMQSIDWKDGSNRPVTNWFYHSTLWYQAIKKSMKLNKKPQPKIYEDESLRHAIEYAEKREREALGRYGDIPKEEHDVPDIH